MVWSAGDKWKWTARRRAPRGLRRRCRQQRSSGRARLIAHLAGRATVPVLVLHALGGRAAAAACGPVSAACGSRFLGHRPSLLSISLSDGSTQYSIAAATQFSSSRSRFPRLQSAEEIGDDSRESERSSRGPWGGVDHGTICNLDFSFHWFLNISITNVIEFC